MFYDNSRHGYLCEQCQADLNVWTARGKCGLPLAGELCGGERRLNGEWVVDCGVAIGAGTDHLGECTRCPIGEIKASQDWIDRVFMEYQSIKRLNCRHDLTIPVELLIAVDDEVERLRIRDLEREKALNKAKSAGRK